MVTVRRAQQEDVPHIVELQHACYPLLATIALWGPHHLLEHQRRFPEGQFVALVGDHVVGHSASFRIASKKAFSPHTFRDITAAGTFANHDPNGDTLYGAEIMVHPSYRRRGIAGQFYKARFALMEELGLRYFVAGGRIPGYESVMSKMSAEDYVRDVVDEVRSDRVLTPQLRSGLQVKGLMPGYLNDPKSGNYATLLFREMPPKPRRASAANARKK